MSLISSRASLSHRTTIERATTETDEWGNPGPPSWASHLADVPCRVWTSTGGQAVDPTTTVVVEDLRLILPLGTDVTEQDRINGVSHRGETIVDGPAAIRAVLHNQDHLELVIVKLVLVRLAG